MSKPAAPVSVLSRLASALTYPLRLEDYLAVIDPRHSSRQLRGLVTSVTPETDRVTTLTISPGRGWLPHRAGQWLRVGVDVGGVRQWRPFSVSSPEGGGVAITVGATGRVSSALAHDTRPGDVLFLDRPQGDFVLPDAPGPLLFVAAGTGITPIMSMIATLLARRPDADIVLVHASRTPDDAIFAGRLATLASGHRGLRVLPHFSRSSGRLALTPASLDALVPGWAARAAYVCGPPGMLADAEALWDAAGASLSVERFTVARRVDPDARGGTVTFARSGRTATVAGAQSLLEAGEHAGVGLPCGCRMGICRTCLTRLAEGQVRDLTTGAVHGEPGDLIRTCISAPAGDVRLDA